MIFLEIVSKLLEEKIITKNKMLTDLKLGKNSFINWQERNTVPSGETLSKIADYFGVSTDYLLGKTNNRNNVQSLNTLSADELKILEYYKKLNPTGQQKAKEYIIDLSENDKYQSDSKKGYSEEQSAELGIG